MKIAQPKPIAAVTAIWPMRLNQPVNHPQAGLPSLDDQPAPRDRDRPALVEGDAVRRQASRQDRDDRERDGEVLEATHAPEELLCVAELVELAGVVVDAMRSGTHSYLAFMRVANRVV